MSTQLQLLLIEFTEAFIHQSLYSRGCLPSETFSLRHLKTEGLQSCVYMRCMHPLVDTYIREHLTDEDIDWNTVKRIRVATALDEEVVLEIRSSSSSSGLPLLISHVDASGCLQRILANTNNVFPPRSTNPFPKHVSAFEIMVEVDQQSAISHTTTPSSRWMGGPGKTSLGSPNVPSRPQRMFPLWDLGEKGVLACMILAP
eukprot:PhF_6_TR18137/c1_g1_i1/m.26950